MSKEDEAVIDMSNMGLLHIQSELQFAFQKVTTLIAYGLSLSFSPFDNDNKVISITTVGNSRLPLPLCIDGRFAPKLDTVIPGPTTFARFLAEVVFIQILVKLIEHDIR